MDPTTAQPYDVMLFRFNGVETAHRVLNRLRADHRLDECEIEGEAFVAHEESGKVRYQEKGSAGIGATFGVVTAGIVGLVAGPIVLVPLVIAAGVAGGLAGHYLGQVLPAEDLKELGAMLPTGTSAYVALVDKQHAEEVAGLFLEEGASVVDLPVEADLSSAVRRAILRRLRSP